MEGTGLDKLASALVALQADLKPVEKTGFNPHFKNKHAELPEVMQAVQPLLAKHKLAVTQWPTTHDGEPALRTILMHESGQTIQDVMPLLLAKEDPQGQGSAITYARRYSLMAVLGLVADEDDDGNAASGPTRGSAPQASTKKLASEKQLNLIKGLAKRKGKDAEWIENVLAATHSSADASAVIDKLNQLEDA